jgi:two-component system NarL family sensor kinase
MSVPIPGPLLRRTLGRHILLTALVAVVLSGLTAVGVWRYAQDDARRTAEKVARQIASAVMVPMSQRRFGQVAGADRDEIQADLAPFLRSGMIDRVKVFTVEAGVPRIVFSDEQRIEGHTGTLRPELAAQLDRGEVVVQPVPDDPEHTYERSLPGERLEVYIALRDADDDDTRLEVYVPVSAAETARRAVSDLFPLLLAGLLLVALATVPLSIALARRMERDRVEQRAVRRYGLAAAELARRDLAQRLHDNVIPGLAGASLLLEAVRAEGLRPGADAPWDLVGRAQGLVADDVRQLRALLDELVPSASAAGEPQVAVRELANQLRRSAGADGPVVEIHVADDHGLSDDAAVLVQRVAGELLRNAFQHAHVLPSASIRIRRPVRRVTRCAACSASAARSTVSSGSSLRRSRASSTSSSTRLLSSRVSPWTSSTSRLRPSGDRSPMRRSTLVPARGARGRPARWSARCRSPSRSTEERRRPTGRSDRPRRGS